MSDAVYTKRIESDEPCTGFEAVEVEASTGYGQAVQITFSGPIGVCVGWSNLDEVEAIARAMLEAVEALRSFKK